MKLSRQTLSLRPTWLVAIALRAMSLEELNLLLCQALKAMQDRYADAFTQLNKAGSLVYAIDPTDLPFILLFSPDTQAPFLRAVYEVNPDEVTATIEGTFIVITRLLEGEADGDALVLSRDLAIRGNSEATYALKGVLVGRELAIKQDMAQIFRRFTLVADKAEDAFKHLEPSVVHVSHCLLVGNYSGERCGYWPQLFRNIF